MLLLFSVRVAERPPVLEKSYPYLLLVRVFCELLSIFCAFSSFPFSFVSGCGI